MNPPDNHVDKPSKRESKTLFLPKEIWAMLEHSGKILQHDSIEETVIVATDILVKAIQVTTPPKIVE